MNPLLRPLTMKNNNNNGIKQLSRYLSIAVLGLMLAACGSGESYDSGGIEGTGINNGNSTRGAISTFGSVFVNGIEYDSNQAEILLNGQTGGLEQALKLGMVVQLDGQLNADGSSGKAQKIEFRSAALGPISQLTSLSSRTSKLRVLGLDILLNEETEYTNSSSSSLALGQLVEVSGFINANGELEAGYLGKKADSYQQGQLLALETRILSLNEAAKSFTCPNLVVDYAQARLATGLKVNQKIFITARGLGADGRLLAERIEPDNSNTKVKTLQTEGILTSFTTISQFKLNDLNIDASKASLNKGSISDLKVGARVEVSGSLTANGTLEASKVTLKAPGEVRIVGRVESLDLNNLSFSILGTRFSVDNLTRYRDSSDDNLRFFTLRNIRVGDQLAVIAKQIGTSLITTQISRDRPQPQNDFRGPITALALASTELKVLDVRVDLSLIQNSPILVSLALGDVIRIRGQHSNGRLLAEQIELDDEFNGHQSQGPNQQQPDNGDFGQGPGR